MPRYGRHSMKNYLHLLGFTLNEGYFKEDRTGTGTLSVFGYQLRFDLSKGFPLVTTKKCHLKSIIHELLWFIKGDTNVKYLQDNGVKIWDEWASDDGELGPIYGAMWRSWPTTSGESIDQLSNVIHEIKTNPNSRRLVVSSWNPEFLPDPAIPPKENAEEGKQALPPCHPLFQFYVLDGKLSCKLYMRSLDLFLGTPFNIASYALLTMMVAHECELELGDFILTMGDSHIYSNHVEQVKEQLKRTPKRLPLMTLNPNKKSIFDFTYDDFTLTEYDPYPAIPGKVAV